jgi:hypothetical protein
VIEGAAFERPSAVKAEAGAAEKVLASMTAPKAASTFNFFQSSLVVTGFVRGANSVVAALNAR